MRENQECNLLKPTLFSPLFSSARRQNGDLRPFRYVTIKSDGANYGKTDAAIQAKSASRFAAGLDAARRKLERPAEGRGMPLAEAHTGSVTDW